MAFPSIAYKSDPRETVAWYKGLAAACGLPIMIYNNPIAYGVDVTPPSFSELADTDVDRLHQGGVRRHPPGYRHLTMPAAIAFPVFCGVDDLILESVALGVTGWVSGMTNAWPDECVKLFDSGRAGRFEEARKLYRVMTPAFHLDTHVKLVQYIKLAEHLVYGAPEWVRAPRLPLEGSERESVTAVIRETIERLGRLESPGSVRALA